MFDLFILAPDKQNAIAISGKVKQFNLHSLYFSLNFKLAAINQTQTQHSQTKQTLDCFSLLSALANFQKLCKSISVSISHYKGFKFTVKSSTTPFCYTYARKHSKSNLNARQTTAKQPLKMHQTMSPN